MPETRVKDMLTARAGGASLHVAIHVDELLYLVVGLEKPV